jgi:hypothetical protein
MERVCDEKSGERRGEKLKISTGLVACFRKIFAAQIPPSPQRDQGSRELFTAHRKVTKVALNLSARSKETKTERSYRTT